ncbi:MAG: kinetochore-associated Ndc80 complex subunit spc24 [Stictis urceolatum]|nr:kinetochore-associated Ndc80 complex subunit spc24 [Stictis urceolata]
MVLLDDHPADLINHATTNFNINPDKNAVARIHESLSTLEQARQLRIREAGSALKRLSRTHTSLAQQHQETVSSHSSAAHAAKIVELDTEKFRIAKSASDLEIESERFHSELDGLRGRLQELESQGVEGDEQSRARWESEDPTVLRLAVYRSLGIDVEADAAGNYSKAVVRNAQKGDVHVVNINPKFSRYFYADFFWGKI